MRAGGVAFGELVDRDLEVEAPSVRSRGLTVQLGALDEHDLDPLAGEVVGERCPREPTTDDQDIRLGRQQAPRRLCTKKRRGHTNNPRSSTDSSATAERGVGLTGDLGVAMGSAPIGFPWRAAISAATCRWQLRPWQRPIVTRVKALTTFTSGVASIARSSSSRRSFLAPAHDRVGRGELVDAGPDAVHSVERPLEAKPSLEPPPDRRRARLVLD